jgi:DNA-damage-inducible protein J
LTVSGSFHVGIRLLFRLISYWTRLPVAFYFSLGYNVAHTREAKIMAENAVVRARINETIKEEAATVLATMGLTVSDAFRLMLTRVAIEKTLPFEPLIPNKETIQAMREARKGKLDAFDSVDDLMADLNK